MGHRDWPARVAGLGQEWWHPATGALGWGAQEPGSPQCPCPRRKEILGEYYSISSLVQEDVLAVHQEIAGAIQAIDPDTEYSGFVQSHRYSLARLQLLCQAQPCQPRVPAAAGMRQSRAGCPQVWL